MRAAKPLLYEVLFEEIRMLFDGFLFFRALFFACSRIGGTHENPFY